MRIAAIAVAILSTAIALPAHAAVIVYYATLDGPSESPPVASPGTGWARVTVDDVAATMHVEAEFQGLVGTTTNAHIHCCTAVPEAGTAGVATTTPTFEGFPSGVTAGSYEVILDMLAISSWNPAFITANGGTTEGALAALLAGMNSGRAYFNVHSSFAGGGEIRGFLQQVPEPGTLALLGLGLAGVGLARRRRMS